MKIMNGFKGSAIKMTVADIHAVADMAGIDRAALRAVLSVETGGSGFDKSGRPKALFERHYFYKFIKDDPVLLDQASAAGLAYPKWGERPYPKGSDAVYAEIDAAYEMRSEAALMATSWGLGQIMGSNWKMTGAASVEEMVRQAMESETNQLHHMIGFIKSAGLLDKLKAKDWAGFAKGYNGPAYAKNSYDTKLAGAYANFTSLS
jgi:hypothetical protein